MTRGPALEFSSSSKELEDGELSPNIEACRVSTIADHEQLSVVMQPSFMGLDENVRFLSNRRRHVDKAALETSATIVRGALEDEQLFAVPPFDSNKPVGCLRDFDVVDSPAVGSVWKSLERCSLKDFDGLLQEIIV